MSGDTNTATVDDDDTAEARRKRWVVLYRVGSHIDAFYAVPDTPMRDALAYAEMVADRHAGVIEAIIRAEHLPELLPILQRRTIG